MDETFNANNGQEVLSSEQIGEQQSPQILTQEVQPNPPQPKPKNESKKVLLIVLAIAAATIIPYALSVYSQTFKKQANVSDTAYTPIVPKNTGVKVQKQSPIAQPSNLQGRIVFVSGGNIYMYNSSGSATMLVKSGSASNILLSPDGSKFVYAEATSAAKPNTVDHTFAVYDFSSKQKTNLPLTVKAVIKWSTDGTLVLCKSVFGNDLNYQPTIFVPQNQVTFPVTTSWKTGAGPADVSFNQWDLSPDGKQLAYLTNEGKLYLQPTATNSATLLAQADASQRLFGPILWTPDGKDILFTRASNLSNLNERGLLAIAPTAKSISEASSIGGFTVPANDAPYPILFSPKGTKLLLYGSNWIFDIINRKQITVFTQDQLKQYSSGAADEDIRWLSDDTLVKVKPAVGGINVSNQDKKEAIALFNTASGTITPIDFTQSDAMLATLSGVDTSGKQILFTKLNPATKERSLYYLDITNPSAKDTLLIKNADAASWGK